MVLLNARRANVAIASCAFGLQPKRELIPRALNLCALLADILIGSAVVTKMWHIRSIALADYFVKAIVEKP